MGNAWPDVCRFDSARQARLLPQPLPCSPAPARGRNSTKWPPETSLNGRKSRKPMTIARINTNMEAWKGERAATSSPNREESPPSEQRVPDERVNKFQIGTSKAVIIYDRTGPQEITLANGRCGRRPGAAGLRPLDLAGREKDCGREKGRAEILAKQHSAKAHAEVSAPGTAA